MEFITFPEVNQTIAETQEDYQDLPAHVSPDGHVTMCMKLNEEELEQVKTKGVIWLQIYNGKREFAPISPTLLDPRVKAKNSG